MSDNLLEPKKDKKGFYEDTKNMTYKDSWLQNTVELAALGTILTGAGTLAVKGDLGGAFRNGQRAFGAMGKGFENYLKRNGSLGSKFGYQVGKRTFQNLLRTPKQTGDEGYEVIQAIIGKSIKDVDDDPATQKRIRDEVARRLQQERNRNVVDKALDGKSRFKDTDEEARARFLYEKVRGEEINKQLYGEPKSGQRFNQSQNTPGNSNPLFDKKQIAKDMVGTGLTGLAFGAGISGFHALDRMSSNPDNQKKLENTFQYGGSFLSKEEKKPMNKSAGQLEFYKGLGGIAKKTPEAIAGGLGFTAVSLGAANVLNGRDPRNLKNGETNDNKSTRVIIELGNKDETANPKTHSAAPMGLAGLPRIASPQSTEIEKTAFPSFNGLKQFARDFKGYGKQIEELKAVNPDDVASVRLKNENVPEMVKQKYGNLVNNEHAQGSFTNKLFDSHSVQAKNEINDTIRDLETQTAKARLQAGAGGLAVAGGGIAGLSAMKSKREEKPTNGPS